MFVRVKILHLMEKFFTIIDSEYNGNGTELTDILETIEKQQFVNPEKLSSYSGEVVLVGINYSTNPDTDYKKYTCKIEKISINN